MSNSELRSQPAADEVMRRSARQAAGFFAASLFFAVFVGGLIGVLLLGTLSTGRDWLGGLGADGARRAHAYAQVFGFAAMYVMGVAFHVLPRLTGSPLPSTPALPWALAGTGLGTALAVGLGLGGVSVSILWAFAHSALLLGALAFALVVGRQLRGAPLPEPMAGYLIAGCGWLALAAALPLLSWPLRSEVPGALGPVWEAMLWGFSVSWIFGMSLRVLPAALGAPWQPKHLDRGLFAAFQLGVAAWVAAHWWAPIAWWAAPASRWLAAGGGVILALAALAYVQRVGVFARARAPVAHPLPGTEKFLLAAYAWLLVALVEGPLWSAGHAYLGTPYGGAAVDFARHAFTFGFLTQMIVGVSMRVIPTAAGLPLWSNGLRDVTFWLLNAGVIVRASEVVAFVRGFSWLYPWTALSGLLAWAALVTFAINVVMTLRGRRGEG